MMEIRVYYEDTDCGGVVYYANYLRYFERARTEFLRDRGVDIAHWAHEGYLFTVADVHARYLASAVYGDLLTVTTSVTQIGKVRFDLAHKITRRDGTLLVTGETTMACVKNARPARMPEVVTAALAAG